MKDRITLILGIIILTLLVINSCSPTTRVTGTWENPEIDRSDFTNVLVAAMTENVNVRQQVEDVVAQQLEKQGIHTSKSMDIFPPDIHENLMEKDDLLETIRNNGHDAVLTITLIDEQTETRYEPGNVSYSPTHRFGYYRSFWGYYSHWHPRVYEPGYYTEDKIYFLETNLYDLESENLVWSAQSETVNPQSLQTFSEQFASSIIEELSDTGVLTADNRE